MTKRLYLEDPYVTSFDAEIIETRQTDEGPAVIFEQTYFYPESGGQPFDLGTIGGVPITQIQIIEDADVSFVGAYNATWRRGRGRRKSGLKPQDMAGWESPIVPLQK